MAPYKTADAPVSETTLVKPGELIDIAEVTPLTLYDRRVFNLLLQNAWENIREDVEHKIEKTDLRGSHAGNERLEDTIGRLQTTRIRVEIERDGQPYRRTIPGLLGVVDDPVRPDGRVYYQFSREVRELITNSNVFARIQKDVMLALSSKYALALYEMIQKRGNLTHVWSETFDVDRLKDLLGVPKDKLTAYKNFKAKALNPAVLEVNGLSNYGVQYKEVKKSRAVMQIQIAWHQKSVQEMKEAFKELKQPRVGRRARLSGTVETSTVDVHNQSVL